MPRSTFMLTVPQDFYDMICDAVSQPFADSYLFGGHLQDGRFTPRTLIGYTRMKDRSDFMALAKVLKLTLVKPKPWPGDGDRLSAKDARG